MHHAGEVRDEPGALGALAGPGASEDEDDVAVGVGAGRGQDAGAGEVNLGFFFRGGCFGVFDEVEKERQGERSKKETRRKDPKLLLTAVPVAVSAVPAEGAQWTPTTPTVAAAAAAAKPQAPRRRKDWRE